jgi:hypothetical protein
MLVAEVSEAFRSVGVQYLIANRKFSLFNGMYYFSPATLVFLISLSFIFERDEVFKPGNTETMREYWYLLLVCATFGFAVNYVCLGVVKHAGSLMVKTMSQLKNVVVIAAAVIIYGDEVSKLEMIGYAVATAGFVAFNHAKALDNVKVREHARRASRRRVGRRPRPFSRRAVVGAKNCNLRRSQPRANRGTSSAPDRTTRHRASRPRRARRVVDAGTRDLATRAPDAMAESTRDDDRALFTSSEREEIARANDGDLDARPPRDVAFKRAFLASVAVTALCGFVALVRMPADARTLSDAATLNAYASCHAANGAGTRRRTLLEDGATDDAATALTKARPYVVMAMLGACAMGALALTAFKRHPRFATWSMICVKIGSLLRVVDRVRD